MTYDKTTRQELMEDEKREDIQEKANEIDDGAFDSWIAENKEDLISGFIDEFNSEWIDFCRTRWSE